jgi:hypothetical protein
LLLILAGAGKLSIIVRLRSGIALLCIVPVISFFALRRAYDDRDLSRKREREQWLRADLAVIDDIGLLPVAQDAAEGLYRLVDAAYEKRSVAVSSNLHPAAFDEPPIPGLNSSPPCATWPKVPFIPEEASSVKCC